MFTVKRAQLVLIIAFNYKSFANFVDAWQPKNIHILFDLDLKSIICVKKKKSEQTKKNHVDFFFYLVPELL